MTVKSFIIETCNTPKKKPRQCLVFSIHKTIREIGITQVASLINHMLIKLTRADSERHYRCVID